MKEFLKIDISAMKRLDEAVKTNKPVLAASAATQVMALTQLEFRQEGRMFHGGWAPLSTGVSKAKTARKRKKNGKLGKARKAKPVLVDTGTLKKSFFVSQSGGGATVGTPVKFAVFHQFGAPAAKNRRNQIGRELDEIAEKMSTYAMSSDEWMAWLEKRTDIIKFLKPGKKLP